jgi:probable rRNA maturation factor
MELDFASTKRDYDFYEKLYLELLRSTLEFLDLNFSPIVSVSLISDDEIRIINKEYRHIDRVTDVISFAFLDNEPNKDAILKSGKEVVLGDIYISIDKAIEQAKSYGHSEKREFSFLFVHGLLHLLGYDHMKKEDEEIMFPLQDEILRINEVKR